MRRGILEGYSVVAFACVGVAALLACTSADEASPVGGGDSGVVDAGGTDGGLVDVDVDADAGPDADDGDFEIPDVAVTCETTPCVKKLAGSYDGFCALLSDGRVSCWGANDGARLGVSDTEVSVPTPTIVGALADVTDIDVAFFNTCARVADRSVYCWGFSELVHAGMVPPDGDPPELGAIHTPTREDAVPAAEGISVGTDFACARLGDGTLSCWGRNHDRELGRGATDPLTMASPARAALLTQPAADVIAGEGRTFVITSEGAVVSWGKSTSFSAVYLLGRDSSEDPNERPTLVPRLSRVRNIATASAHSCAVTGRFVTCWGHNISGQLGRGSFEDASYLPGRTLLAEVTDSEDADAGTSNHDVPVQVVTGQAHSCAVMGSGRVYCWGDAGTGRLLGSRVNAQIVRGAPTRIDGFSGPVVALAAGNGSMCGLLRSGAVECWGRNDRGGLGIGKTDDDPHAVPVRVAFPQ